MPLSVGSRLGRYDVTALIGQGGMGQVYQATMKMCTRVAFQGGRQTGTAHFHSVRRGIACPNRGRHQVFRVRVVLVWRPVNDYCELSERQSHPRFDPRVWMRQPSGVFLNVSK